MRWGPLTGSRSFALYWSARTVSIAGNQIARVALTVLVYQLGAGPAGVIATVLAATAFSTLHLPAGRGNIPVLAGRDNLARANAQLAIGSNAALALGPALGAVLLAVGGTRQALLANAATFVFSAVLTLGIRGLRPPSGETRPGGPVTLLGQSRAGVGVVWQNRVARAVALMLLPSVAFASLDNAALIFLVRRGFHAGAGAYAWVITAYSVGMAGMPLLLSLWRGRLDARPLLFAGEGLFGASTLVTGLAPTLTLGAGAQVAAGAGNGLENTGMDTLLQESAPDEQLGLVFGTVYTAPYAGQIVAYLVAAPVIAAIGPRATFVAAGAGVLAALAALAWMLPRRRPEPPGPAQPR